MWQSISISSTSTRPGGVGDTILDSHRTQRAECALLPDMCTRQSVTRGTPEGGADELGVHGISVHRIYNWKVPPVGRPTLQPVSRVYTVEKTSNAALCSSHCCLVDVNKRSDGTHSAIGDRTETALLSEVTYNVDHAYIATYNDGTMYQRRQMLLSW